MAHSYRRAVFLDRDGTIARDVPYCSRPEDFELLSGIPEAVRLLNESGFLVVVITNQSGIGRGYLTEEALRCIHQKMVNELGRHSARIDGIYYCPHHPDDRCDCRKPGITLFQKAAKDLNINLSQSFMIGDMQSDIDAGRAIGARTIKVTTGPGGSQNISRPPDFVADSFQTAVQWILNAIPSKGLR